MARLEKVALHYYYSGSPRADLLLHLVQLNFTRALMENTRILGLTADNLHDDAISPFNTIGPWHSDSLQNLPITLQPTAMQRCIPHHPWLDLLPDPQLRDNLILAGDFEEERQLCLDMKGSGTPKSQTSGIIIWSDPWDPAGWEITEPFAHSWGWVIRNCRDLAYSTNHWRAKRHERPLFRLTWCCMILSKSAWIDMQSKLWNKMTNCKILDPIHRRTQSKKKKKKKGMAC